MTKVNTDVAPALQLKKSGLSPFTRTQISRSSRYFRRKKARLVRSGFLRSGSQTGEDTSSVDA